MHRVSKFSGGFFAILGIAALSTSSEANLSSPRDAQVILLDPITINAGSAQDLDFGTAILPGTGVTGVISMPIGGPRAGSNITLVGSAGNEADYSIEGDNANTISISVSDGGSVSGFSLSNWDLEYNSSSFSSGDTGLAAPDAGTTLKIGADLDINGTIVTTANTYNPDYIVNITYD